MQVQLRKTYIACATKKDHSSRDGRKEQKRAKETQIHKNKIENKFTLKRMRKRWIERK